MTFQGLIIRKKHGRFPKKKEWWGSEKNEKEWEDKWILEHRKY